MKKLFLKKRFFLYENKIKYKKKRDKKLFSRKLSHINKHTLRWHLHQKGQL